MSWAKFRGDRSTLQFAFFLPNTLVDPLILAINWAPVAINRGVKRDRRKAGPRS